MGWLYPEAKLMRLSVKCCRLLMMYYPLMVPVPLRPVPAPASALPRAAIQRAEFPRPETVLQPAAVRQQAEFQWVAPEE